MPCIFEECPNPGLYTLGIRLRRPEDNLTAIWAPETGASVCDYHARRGMTITIQLDSMPAREIETTVQGVTTRRTPIRNYP